MLVPEKAKPLRGDPAAWMGPAAVVSMVSKRIRREGAGLFWQVSAGAAPVPIGISSGLDGTRDLDAGVTAG